MEFGIDGRHQDGGGVVSWYGDAQLPNMGYEVSKEDGKVVQELYEMFELVFFSS